MIAIGARLAGVRLRLLGVAGLIVLAGSAAGVSQLQPARASSPLTFDTVNIDKGGFEPRIAVGPDNQRWDSTQDATGAIEVVFGSKTGHTWTRTASDPPSTPGPCCDNDMIVTPTGRLISSIIDNVSLQIKVHYSDDNGATWSNSTGTTFVDQDRQWFAVGPKDATTGQNVVYMLWHNLGSGTADHEMLVSTSRDNGATFLPPVPVTLPGSQAWLDLQCADSGGPSNIVTNPKTGQVYAIFGTRSSALGGCGASVLGPFEINIVAATRAWVSTSTDEGLTWSPSLAVDDSTAGNIVGMQVNAGAVDNSGNVYVVYPESPNKYPDYSGAAIKYRWAPADLSHWSNAVTVAPAGGAGHILADLVAGDAGKLGFFYVTGVAQGGQKPPLWYPTSAETLNGLDASPAVSEVRIANVPMWTGTATTLMGACNTLGGLPQTPPFDTIDTAVSGFTCGRSSDVLGMSIDSSCHFMSTWYASQVSDGGIGGAPAGSQGTYVSTQNGGSPLGTSCSVGGLPPATSTSSGGSNPATNPVIGGSGGTPNTSAGTAFPAALFLVVLAALAAGVIGRRSWRS